MIRIIYYIFLCPFIINSFAGCSKSHLDEDKFIIVYTDIIMAQDTLGRRNSLDYIKRTVFKRNNISEQEYDMTLKYYNDDPVRWEQFFDKAIVYLEKKKNKTQN